MNKIKQLPPLTDLVIIGANDTAKRVLYFCERYNLYKVIGFAVNKKYIKDKTLCGRPVWAIEELDEFIDRKTTSVFVALFWNHLNGDRRRLYEYVKSLGYSFVNIISPLASVRGKLGENCWIMDYVVLQEGSVLGNNIIVADFALVGNNAEIANHCFLAARSTIMGSANIGEQTFVGVGAFIFDVVKIGKKCLVGACTVQKYDLPECSVTKVITTDIQIKQYPEDAIEDKWVARHPNRLNKNRNINVK